MRKCQIALLRVIAHAEFESVDLISCKPLISSSDLECRIERLNFCSLTQAITKLSQDSWHVLLQRSPQGLFLTDAGMLLHYRADRPLRILDKAMTDLDRATRIQAAWQQPLDNFIAPRYLKRQPQTTWEYRTYTPVMIQ